MSHFMSRKAKPGPVARAPRHLEGVDREAWLLGYDTGRKGYTRPAQLRTGAQPVPAVRARLLAHNLPSADPTSVTQVAYIDGVRNGLLDRFENLGKA